MYNLLSNNQNKSPKPFKYNPRNYLKPTPQNNNHKNLPTINNKKSIMLLIITMNPSTTKNNSLKPNKSMNDKTV